MCCYCFKFLIIKCHCLGARFFLHWCISCVVVMARHISLYRISWYWMRIMPYRYRDYSLSSQLEFNVTFQHKYGYIKDSIPSQTNRYSVLLMPSLLLSSVMILCVKLFSFVFYGCNLMFWMKQPVGYMRELNNFWPTYLICWFSLTLSVEAKGHRLTVNSPELLRCLTFMKRCQELKTINK